MKVKGISFFELHAEKILLGLAVLLLVAVVAMQLLGGGTRVRVDNREVAVGEVNSILKQRAEQLAASLRADSPAGVQLFEGDPPLIAAAFEESMDAAVAPAARLPQSQPALAAALVPSDIAEVAWYYEPKFPAVSMGEVVQTSDAVTAEGWADLAPLGGRFESEPTSYDITWLTPSASVDLASLRDELRRSAARSTPPRLAVPSVWFNDMLYLVDVVFERQRLIDGAWGQIQVVEAFPTQDSYRPYLADADAALRDDVFEELRLPARQLEVLQPEFVATTNGSFVAPLEVDSSDGSAEADSTASGNAEELRRLRRELQRYRQDEARTKARLDELGGPLRDDEEKPAGRPGSRGSRGDRGGSGGGGSGGTAPPRGGGLGSGGLAGRRGADDAAQDEATKKRRKALGEKLSRIASQIERTEADIARLAPGLDAGSGAVELLDINTAGSVVVWTHDLNIAAGEVYRYRVRVDAYNPFFARTTQLVPEQQPLAAGFTRGTATSEWSPPVKVTPPVAFYLARATPSEGALGLGSASFEVFAFRDGKRRSQTFSLQPGDAIGERATIRRPGQPSAEIDFGTGWYVIDVISDPSRDDVSGGDRTRGAIVLVGRLDDPTVVEQRFVEFDRNSEMRRRFLDEVRAADSAESG